MKPQMHQNTFTTLGHPLYEFNAAVQRLQEEHVLLDEALTELYAMAKAIGLADDSVDWARVLHVLRDKTIVFQQDLDAHAKWEAETMFPMAAWYFGDEANVLELYSEMEQEHVIADQFIAAFVTRVERIVLPVASLEAKELASYLMQACAVLKHHFRQEEDMIEALADRSNQYGF
ncbi:hemerythrin domain-containing protein [Paenibacillus sp. NPDC056579]|uniref:hemerythrin domain-containing protein n=1 Tax=Paenibacillus sp. NPDC056579 TaxID=3345871 RepID=UPI0036C3ACA8